MFLLFRCVLELETQISEVWFLNSCFRMIELFSIVLVDKCILEIESEVCLLNSCVKRIEFVQFYCCVLVVES